jgi:hypothetical protein
MRKIDQQQWQRLVTMISERQTELTRENVATDEQLLLDGAASVAVGDP